MTMSWKNSRIEFERASRVIPGGVNSPARAFRAVHGHPIVMQKAEGPFLYDVDGNRYIDYIGSWGPMILGHRHPKVVSAVKSELDRAMSYGAPSPLEADLAERVVAAVPSVDQVRMTSSGTEAAMSALRVARGYTGRDFIIKFAGCYHGHVDSLLVQAGSGAMTLGTPTSPGVPADLVKQTLVLRYNDIDQLHDTFRQRPGQIAAVMLEPVVGNMGLVAPVSGFLETLRKLTRDDGALLIFDEVMTGFRLAYGGAQERFGIIPDMTAFGKIIGGGMPVGAYGGRADVMAKVSPAGPVYQAGTLSGNPLAMASGIATLDLLRVPGVYDRLEFLADRLARGLEKAAQDAGIPHTVPRVGSMLTLFFHPEPVLNVDIASQADTERFARFFWKMMSRGIYWPCSQFEALFVSLAHTEELIDETIAAARESLCEIAHEEMSPGSAPAPWPT
ncbi:glutamate-1-semialdehyde 2,1-aminomutase [bacterium]|jgi:glutamate-1-semialdehyde 2,1-aminomutase|nr:glutamate-1-semialdehyde 2,1-aminomutase [bacterium]